MSSSEGLYVYEWDGMNWIETTPIPDAETVLAVDDDVMLTSNCGLESVCVFRRDGTDWTQEDVIVSPNPEVEGFGTAASVAGDVVAIGGVSYDSQASTTPGGFYVFRFDGSEWIHEATPLEVGPNTWLGVSIDTQPDLLLLGARTNDGDCQGTMSFGMGQRVRVSVRRIGVGSRGGASQ